MSNTRHKITEGVGPGVAFIKKTRSDESASDSVQKVTRDWDELVFDATPNALDSVSVAGSESADIDCEGLSTIILKTEYSGVDVTAPVWVVVKTATGIRGYSVKRTSANTGEQDDIQETGYFHGEILRIDVIGAKSFRVVLADEPSNSGAMSVWATAV